MTTENPTSMHPSMTVHPQQGPAMTYIFHPTEGKKKVTPEEAAVMLKDGWYDSPALFPGNMSEEDRKAMIAKKKAAAEAELAKLKEMEELEVSEDIADVSMEETVPGTVVEEQVTLPAGAEKWTKDQIRSYAEEKGLDCGFTARDNKDTMLQKLVASL